MSDRLKPEEVHPGMLVGIDARRFSSFLGEDLSSRIGIVIKSITKKQYRVAWTTGEQEDVWIWQLTKHSGQ